MAVQGEQATVEDNEYLPARHKTQLVAPGDVPLFVMEPTAHKEHPRFVLTRPV